MGSHFSICSNGLIKIQKLYINTLLSIQSMNGWIYVVLFFVILFIYIHIQHELKTGTELEVYEYEYVSKGSLQETCQLKQPFIFSYEFPRENGSLETLSQLLVKDIRDITELPESQNHVNMISLGYESAKGLLYTDQKSVFYSHRNGSAIYKESNWTQWFQTLDHILKPPFCVYTEYDVIYGSRKTHTTPIFHRESHVFLYIPPESNTASVRIRLLPNKRTTQVKHDYIHYEFWSNMDLYDGRFESKPNQALDIFLKPNQVLFVPPHWMYSIEFQSRENEIIMVKYHTGANMLANIKHMCMYFLQQQNIEEKWWKPLERVNFSLLPEDDIEEVQIEPSDPILSTTLTTKQKSIEESSTKESTVANVINGLIDEISAKN
jgi:hypothetical protein